MKCYYEILEVPRDADDSQIKSAYRKLALKWHPDKNLNNEEIAKEQFQLVQQAYDVLSDRQERAWYDNHREQILRGKNSEYNDNSLDVYQYFTTACFKGYNDEDGGFYSVYRKVFEEIAREDIEYMEDKEEFCEIPSFGASTSDYDETVGPFYAYWSCYSTKKSYVWLDPYNINETRDRKIVKLMEKENKKIRQKARKERNEEIRALVAFVKKRDKRVQEYSKKLEAKILENRQKQEQLSKQRRLEHKKKLNESQTQAEWTKFDNVKNELEEIEKHVAEHFGEQISDSDDDMEEPNNLYCIACNKVFKTPKAFENHEVSKKHKENIDRLKQSMLDEETDMINTSDKESLDEQGLNNVDNEELSDILDTQSEDGNEVKRKKKQKKSKNILRVELSDGEDKFFVDNNSVDVEEIDFSNSSKKQKRKNRKSNPKTEQTTTKDDIDHAENIQSSQISQDIKQEKVVPKTKKEKRTKRDKKEKEEQQLDIDISHCCVTCKANFPSKNKLFDHLKKSGHSVYVHQNAKDIKSGKFVKGK